MKINYNLPCVLSIAGTDPSGGAGIQADIKAISATGSYAASVITVLVAQNTQGVQAIQKIPIDFLQKQIDAVFNDLQFSGVKLGMLYNQAIIEVITKNLKKYRPNFIVLDPVMISQSGHLLLKASAVAALARLFPLVSLVTPNIPEAEILLNRKINTLDAMKTSALDLANQHQVSVLLKGGHLKSTDSPDVFYDFEKKHLSCFNEARIDTIHTHGTGCTLSSAITSYLAQGLVLYDAIVKAKTYLHQALIAGKTLGVGKGTGPVDHFFNRNHECFSIK